MRYDEGPPIHPSLATAWLVELPDGRRYVCLWHREATLEDVHFQMKQYHEKFRLMNIMVGEFGVAEDSHYYAADGRMVDQDMNFATFSEEYPTR